MRPDADKIKSFKICCPGCAEATREVGGTRLANIKVKTVMKEFGSN